jgi:hemoglobin
MCTHLRWSLLLLGAVVLAVTLNAGRADDDTKDDKKPPPVERKEIDAIAYKTLRDVINRGAEVYNAGDVNGCWRLYEGALLMLKPMLDHRPELQKAIDDGVAGAVQTPLMDRRAWVLRGVIDRIRKETGPGTGMPAPIPMPEVKKDGEAKKNPLPEKPAAGKDDESKKPAPAPKPADQAKDKLWDRLGGEENVARILDDFYQAVKDDKDVNFFRKPNVVLTKQEVNDLKEKMKAFISSVSEGPLKYEGKDMREAHKGMGITDKEFDAAAKDLAAALRKNNVKLEDAKEFMQKVEATRPEIVEKKGGDK